MIISRTPFRISFFGGGTDYPTWARDHGGAVLSTTFDKYCYISARELPPFFDHKYRITYSKVEDTQSIEQIQHPAIRAVLNEVGFEAGLEIHCDADLPARSGLGSSSSFVVGLLHAMAALKGNKPSRPWLAQEAIRIEQEVLSENVGSQDQIAAAFGGFNLIEFQPDGGFQVTPVELPDKRLESLESHLMLFFTGFSRIASVVAKSIIENLKNKSTQLHRIRAMVDEALEVLRSGADIRVIGEMLHQSWEHKRSLTDKVSTAAIDSIYDRARQAGAIGGKLLGAGGGGFLLLYVPPSQQQAVRQALNELVCVPFRFENTGSQIGSYRHG